jgi:hypothetical protein
LALEFTLRKLFNAIQDINITRLISYEKLRGYIIQTRADIS